MPLDVSEGHRRVSEVRGDFFHAPGSRASKRDGFDGKTSRVVESETTPTRRVYANADGTRTLDVSSRPVRFRDQGGAWRDIDLTLDRDGGDFKPGAAARPSTIPGRADGAAVVATAVGEIRLTHPGAAARSAAVDGSAARYVDALGSSDLDLRVTETGIEESFVVPDASSASSYRDHLVVPTGLTVRQAGGDVEFVDAAGAVVAEFGHGVATDSAKRAASAAVTVALVAQQGNDVDVDIAVDPDWFASAKRVFPVVIDPLLLDKSTTLTDLGIDTSVSDSAPTTSYSSITGVYAGYNPLQGSWWGLLKFDLGTAPIYDNFVSEAHVSLYERTPTSWGCSTPGPQLQMTASADSWGANVTWNTRPLHGTNDVTYRDFDGCNKGWQDFDATPMAQKWMDTSRPNYGLIISRLAWAQELRAFDSAENSSGFAPRLRVTYSRRPSPPVLAAPADKELVATPTPTLSVNASSDPEGDPVKYWFRVMDAAQPRYFSGFNSPASVVANSGWTSATSWQVPAGVLRDGVSYYWEALASDGNYYPYDGVPPYEQGTGPSYRKFSVDAQRGADERRPSDVVGPVRVNLTNGNATVGIGSSQIPTVGGSLGVSMAYNSATVVTGLTAVYEKNNTALPPTSKVSPPLLQRKDPVVDFTWGTGSPDPSVPSDYFRATWQGYVTVPTAGAYEFGAAADDGVRIDIGGTRVLDKWQVQSAATTNYGTAVSLAAQQTVPIKIEYFEGTGSAEIHLWVRQNGTPLPLPVPWLTPLSSVPTSDRLPVGWTLSGGSADLAYVGARVSNDGSVALDGPDGFSELFAWTGSGYAPPPDSQTTLKRDSAGQIVATDPDGGTYMFSAAGWLLSATTPLDDSNPAATTYGYEGLYSALTKLTDPVSSRQATLDYQGNLASRPCPTPPPGAGFDATAPEGMLCQVSLPDGRATKLFYKSARLSRVENPGSSVTDFGYDSNQLIEVRDPLAYDAITAGVRADDATTRTTIAYDTAGRAISVTLPAPTVGAARPVHSYSYASTNRTDVHVAGLTEPNGYARRVDVNPSGHTTVDTDATAKTTSTTWDERRRPIVVVNPAGLQTSIFYDAAGNVTDQYGPAPVSWFDAATRKPTTAHNGDVPHSTTAYDEGMAGLAAAWHNNLDLLGAPKAHTTAAATNSWGTGSPATGVPVDDFSGALTGQVTMGSGGGTLAVNTSPSNVETSGAKIRVDDEVVVDTSVSTYRSRIRADGPIASWRLGEAAGAATAVDQTATANGSYVGAITRGAASGVPLDTDKSVTNAAGGRVVVPHTAALNLTGELTIEAWVRPTSTAHYHMIVAKSVGDGGSNNNYEFRLNPSLAPEFVQYQNGAFRLVTGASTAALGAWSHVVVTKRFDTVTFWINGVRAGTGTIGYSPPPSTNTRPLYIGARDDIGTTGYSYDFEGGLDDVALYGRALTEAEVGAHASIYARTVAADSPREWVRLNEATGQSIRDSGPVGGSIATPEGGVTAGAPGLVGDGSPAMSFDGVSGDVRFLCCRDFLRWADGFSLEAWVKPTAANADGRILVMTNPTGTNGLTLSRVGTTNTLAFTVNVAGANTTITALNALPLNTTSHLGVTVTKTGAATLFRNGAVIATGTVPLPATVLRETSYLGRSPAGNFWKGTIDEVAVYDSPLPPGRFAVHYAAGTGGAVGTISSGTIPAGDHRLSAEYRAGIGSATLTLIGTNLVGGLRPAYGLPTSSVDPDGKQTTTAYSSPQLAQPSMTTADPAGLALTTTFGYEPATGAGNYARRVSRTLPANNAWTYAYYGTTQTADNPCTGTVEAINQAAAQRTRTGPAPSGAGSERVEETVYDAGGRAVASRISTAAGLAAAPWTCATFDDRDRPTNTTIPARGAEPARTVTSNWAVGGNPLVTFLSDATGTITTTVDLLGRVISATDVWGKTTTTTYDQPGRVTDTASPQGLLHVDYDPAGRPTAQKLGGALVATPAYDSAGRLASVSYPSGSGNAGNGTSLAVGLDTLGRTNSFGWKQAGGILDLATDAVTRSLAGRINDESADLLDANPAGDNFSYDGAGRLTDAWSLAHHYTYSFATGTCGSANAGKNANVTSATDNLTTTTFCYDSADWMTSSTAPGAGTAGSDDHGNTTSLDATTLAYDGADRHVTTNAGSTSVRYQRDALDRIVARTENGQTVRYAFANGGDSPVATLDTANTVTEAQVSLLGGAMITTRAGGNVWSYPNIHGDTVATADAAGAKTGGGVAYDPYGNQISASGADNSGSNFDYGWLGAHKRGTDHASGVPTVIEMGARPYLPVVGRFLSVDPIEGGCANSYTYVHGDPINELDLSGTKTCAGPANLVLRSYWKTVGSGVAFGLLQAGLRWTGEYRVKVRMLSGVWGAFGYADSVSGKRGHTGSINPFQTLTFKFAGTLGPATRTLTVNWAALPIYDYRSVSYTNAFQWQIDIKIYYWEAVQPRCS